MQTKYLCVLIHIWIKGEVGAVKPVSALQLKYFYWPFQGGSSFVDRFCWLCFMLVFVVLSCLFHVALWSPAGKGLTSWLLCLLCFVTFQNVPWSTSELMARLAPWNWFKPSSKIFYWPFQCGTSFEDLYVFVLSCICYVFVRVCLYVLCGHLLGKGWPRLSFVVSNCELVTFPLVSWVRCGTWLYRFLIVAPLLT